MMDLAEFERMRTRVSSLMQQQSRAEGALEQLMKTLEQEFGCQSMEEAGALILKWKQELEEKSEEFKQKRDLFLERWGDLLANAESEM